ncbi:DUF4224 domain-containing protein [Serratia rhizosphaerae]|uniref:DUF4224 domain-containing protein n=1 Tax=Serratia rhizosphaerae TaxID=2597702 RepID=A0ABX6GHL9_9GAMM|nr:DUF4224 domain-containing protein [Serratia rhizosphaerae]QHA85734.1 DUF4224 domain-containing protein [Serratia rhizosphaerae]
MANNENSFLTREEVERMTGYKLPSKQRAVLDKCGILYVTDKDGYPSTTWYSLNNPLSVRNAAISGDNNEPNFDAI